MDAMTQMELWSAFVARVKLTFPFRVDVMIEPADQARSSTKPGDAQMAIELHVQERDTGEMITVKTRRPCGNWRGDAVAEELLFDLLETALKHEMHEATRIDGQLVRDAHRSAVNFTWPRRCSTCDAEIIVGLLSNHCDSCRNPPMGGV